MFVPVCRAPFEEFLRFVKRLSRGNWNWLEESGDAPLDLLSSSEIVPCF